MCVGVVLKGTDVKAASKAYGILLADKKGSYTYYDFNGAKGSQRIEVTKKGNVMIPLRAVCGKMESISYTYDWNKNQATLVNKKTGKKLVFTEKSQYAKFYASKKAKAKSIKMGYKMYLSPSSNAAMVEGTILKHLFVDTAGFKYYSMDNKKQKSLVVSAGFDAPTLKGLFVWNPYKKVTKIPAASKVKYKACTENSDIVKVTVPEGYSAAQIAKLFVSKGVCQSTSAFLDAINKVDLSKYRFYDIEGETKNRCFKAEGYLFCSTYECYRNSSPSTIINKMLSAMNRVVTDKEIHKAHELGYTMDDVLIVASIIEKEISISSQQAKVASVLYNRLEQNMRLQCDSSIFYVERYIKPFITGDINRYNGFYNTYKCKALPAGPICNPSRKAIAAALNPEQTNYLYFCSDDKNNYYYAETFEEHKENYSKYCVNQEVK